MNYDGKPRHPLPSRRYPIFIQAFEKKVSQAQKEVEYFNSLQRLYQVVWEVLETFNLSNEGGMEITSTGILVKFRILPSDKYQTFNALAGAISKALKESGFYLGDDKTLPRKTEDWFTLDVQWTIPKILTIYGGASRVMLSLSGDLDHPSIIITKKRIDVPASYRMDTIIEWVDIVKSPG